MEYQNYSTKHDVLIDALHINSGGGKVLLDYLIEQLEQTGLKVFYLLDNRIRLNHPKIKPENGILFLKGTFLNRILFYAKYKNNFQKILCFGNLPPYIKCRNSCVYTYLHQRLYLNYHNDINLILGFKFFFKSQIFKRIIINTNFWCVQTEDMKFELTRKYQAISPNETLVLPFYPPLKSKLMPDNEIISFVYVSSGVEYKNHSNLLKAFRLLCKNHPNKKVELHLTISEEFPLVLDEINDLIENGYPIINHGFIDRNELSDIYGRAKYCIFPSLNESYGLGIIEALENNCKIIASDLSFVHSVCVPSIIFDPIDPYSIYLALLKSTENNIKDTIQKSFNEINTLLKLLS